MDGEPVGNSQCSILLEIKHSDNSKVYRNIKSTKKRKKKGLDTHE